MEYLEQDHIAFKTEGSFRDYLVQPIHCTGMIIQYEKKSNFFFPNVGRHGGLFKKKKKKAFPYFFLGLPNFQTQQFNGREGLSASIINSPKINAFLELGFSFFHIWSSPEACLCYRVGNYN